MNICLTCGNEIPDTPPMCPYCGSQQDASQTSYRSGKSHKPGARNAISAEIITLNLETGMPDVEQALARIDMKVSEARQQGIRLIRLIHGWGSSGTGGRIKEALPQHLADLKRRRVIRGYVQGEHYSISTRQGNDLLTRYPALKATLPTDRKNPGITFVEL